MTARRGCFESKGDATAEFWATLTHALLNTQAKLSSGHCFEPSNCDKFVGK